MKTKQSMKPVLHGAKKHWAESRPANVGNTKNPPKHSGKSREGTWSSWLTK
jgi:hypothetical protein